MSRGRSSLLSTARLADRRWARRARRRRRGALPDRSTRHAAGRSLARSHGSDPVSRRADRHAREPGARRLARASCSWARRTAARICRLDARRAADPPRDGAQALAGGSDARVRRGRPPARRRLHADPRPSPPERPTPPGLEQFRDEDYRGPLRLPARPGLDDPAPRRLGGCRRSSRGAGARPAGCALPARCSSRWRRAAAISRCSVLVRGAIHASRSDGALVPLAQAAAGPCTTDVNMVAAPDGTLLRERRVLGRARLPGLAAPAPSITLATDAGRPPGHRPRTRDGTLYVAESSLHRILRLHPVADPARFDSGAFDHRRGESSHVAAARRSRTRSPPGSPPG